MKLDDLRVHVVSYPLREQIQFSWEPFPRPVYVFSIVEVVSGDYRGFSAIEFGPAYKQYLETTVKLTLQGLGVDLEESIRDCSKLVAGRYSGSERWKWQYGT